MDAGGRYAPERGLPGHTDRQARRLEALSDKDNPLDTFRKRENPMNPVDELSAALKPHVEAELIKITQAPVASIFASLTNPRKTFDADGLRDLTESIRLHGVLQPILVRPLPLDEWITVSGGEPAYEVVAGERRWRAARAAGLAMIDVRVRDLSDREVLELQIVENLQRADLHPLEEADGYSRMMKSYDYTADDLAAKVGKSRAYIYGRLKLCDLHEDGRAAFVAGTLTASTALLLARVPTHKLQARALEDILQLGEGAQSVRRVKQALGRRYMLNLAGAKFPIGDRDLCPSAGSCTDCPKRTGHQPEIFDDVEDADVCTDPDCFEEKGTAHVQRIAGEARARGETVISGDEAKKLCPYGIPMMRTSASQMVGVDAICFEDREGRTYREIFGDALEPKLIEDVWKGGIAEAVEVSALEVLLIQAGLIGDKAAEKKRTETERAKAAAKLARENAFRARLWGRIRDVNLNLFGRTDAVLLRLVAEVMWSGLDYDTKRSVVDPEGALGKGLEAEVRKTEDRIASMDSRCLSNLIIDMTVAGDAKAHSWDLPDYQPRKLIEVAHFLGIDPDDVRREVAAAEAKVRQPVTGGIRSVKYRCPRFGTTWSGRGKKPAWVNAWLAEGKTLEELLVPAAAD